MIMEVQIFNNMRFNHSTVKPSASTDLQYTKAMVFIFSVTFSLQIQTTKYNPSLKHNLVLWYSLD